MENKTGYATQEMLEALVKGQRKALRHSRIVTLICLLLAGLLVLSVLVAIPRVTAALGRMEDAFSSVENSLPACGRPSPAG